MKKEDKKLKNFLFYALPLLVIAIALAYFINIKTVITILLFLYLLIGYKIYKEKIGQEMIIAFLMALTLTSYYLYEYTSTNYYLGKINLFPLVSWTFGLVLLREIYEKVKSKNKFLYLSLAYIAGLLLLEAIGFHLLNIQLDSDFPSLLGLGVIHAPLGMKAFYILAGPVYLLITDYLKVK